MTIYECDGFRAYEAKHAAGAADVFASRLARREYGKAGYVRTIRLDSWTQDGSIATFECFIGRPLYGLTRNESDRGTTTGHNVRLTVYRRR